MSKPLVSILVPNYKTRELTQLCLRLLRKYTDPALARIVVVDNDSQDESLDYLRHLRWIELIERKSIPGESPPLSHARALDLGMAQVTTPYVLSIHTDTLAKHPKWLEFLLEKIEHQPQVAGVGSWKLESKPWFKRYVKALERQMQLVYYQLCGKTSHAIEGRGKNYYYLRSHCAMYRMDLVQKFALSFAGGEDVAGKVMHKTLVDAGYRMLFLPSEQLGQYIDHINHATMVLNPELGARQKTIKQGKQRLEQRLKAVNAEQILRDLSLDN